MTRAELRAFWSTVLLAGQRHDLRRRRRGSRADLRPGRAVLRIDPARDRREARASPCCAFPKSGEIRMRGRGLGRDSVDLYYRAPAGGTEEALALELLASYLGDPEGPLFEDLVEKEQDRACRLRRALRRPAVRRDDQPLGDLVPHRDARGGGGADPRRPSSRSREQPLPDEAHDAPAAPLPRRVLGALQSDMRLGFLILRREMGGSWRDIERGSRPVEDAHRRGDPGGGPHVPRRRERVVTWYTMDEEAGEPAPAATARPMPAQATRAAAARRACSRSDVPASWTDLTYEERAPSCCPSGRARVTSCRTGSAPSSCRNEGDPVVRVSAQVLGGAAEDPPGQGGLCAELAAGVLGEAGIPGLSPRGAPGAPGGHRRRASPTAVGPGQPHRRPSRSSRPTWTRACASCACSSTEPQLDPQGVRAPPRRAARADRRRGDAPPRRDLPPLPAAALGRRSRDAPPHAGEPRSDHARRRAGLPRAPSTGPQRDPPRGRPVTSTWTTLVARLERRAGRLEAGGRRRLRAAAPTKNDRDAAARRPPRARHAGEPGIRPHRPGDGAARPRGRPGARTSSRASSRAGSSTRCARVHGLSYQAGARFTPSWRNDSPFTIIVPDEVRVRAVRRAPRPGGDPRR